MFLADIAEPAREHDGFVETAHMGTAGARHPGLEGSEIADDIGAAEFVVVRGPANGRFEHDVQGRCDALGFPEIALPRLLGSGNAQV